MQMRGNNSKCSPIRQTKPLNRKLLSTLLASGGGKTKINNSTNIHFGIKNVIRLPKSQTKTETKQITMGLKKKELEQNSLVHIDTWNCYSRKINCHGVAPGHSSSKPGGKGGRFVFIPFSSTEW